ncbi:membrane glycoprotein US7 [Panine betaherpesvirus 2]|uniref:Membrane glycoprotein US7 n=1 Tax=Panine betaherpesvirus 2 TaxID=188763 RepID=Q8QRV2_9BETA|nr:membrane glycoprotein US7 [Panine betaherpesvirus 2]AAM00786.1 membrane glycoprotein US7 [Panine betaherpesvirus 2]QXV67904.1 membrane glycoprotein US7 [Panine betaherpesvirus 2]
MWTQLHVFLLCLTAVTGYGRRKLSRREIALDFMNSEAWESDLIAGRLEFKKFMRPYPKNNMILSHTVSCTIYGGNMTGIWHLEGQFYPSILSEIILTDSDGSYEFIPHKATVTEQSLSVEIKHPVSLTVSHVSLRVFPVKFSQEYYSCTPTVELPWIPQFSFYEYDSYRLSHEGRFISLCFYVMIWAYLITLALCATPLFWVKVFEMLRRGIKARYAGSVRRNSLFYAAKCQ